MGKSALKSKTLWVGIMTLVASTLGFLQGQDLIAQYPQVVAVMGASIGAIGIVLRFFTSEPIK